jgi:hypothetical protein
MKKWFVAGGVLIVLFIGGYLVLSFYAVKWIQPQIQKMMGPGLTVTGIEVKTTYLSAKGVQYEEPYSQKKLLQIEEVRIYPALGSFLKGQLKIRELCLRHPFFYIYRSREGVLFGSFPPVGSQGKEEGGPDREKGSGKELLRVKIDKVRIEKGSIDFEDWVPGDPPAKIRLRELDFEMRTLRYPIVSAPVPFEMKGRIKGRTREGEIETQGWLNLKAIEMETSFNVRKMEIHILEPYYRKKISAEIESGEINLEAKIFVKQGMIDAPGSLEFVDLRIREEGTVFWIPAKTLASLLKGKGNRVKAPFRVKGDIRDPGFNLQETFLSRVAVSLAGTLGLPIKEIGETRIGGTGKGAEGWAEGLKSLEEIFKKKRK